MEDDRIYNFGEGRLVIECGSVGGRPAVLVSRAVGDGGPPGSPVRPEDERACDGIDVARDEIALTFEDERRRDLIYHSLMALGGG